MSETIPSRSTLDELPGRVLKFLRALGTSPSIRAQMAAVGYTKEEHELGWSLLHKVTGFAYVAPSLAPDADPRVTGAIHDLDAWDDPNFAAIRAALDRKFPAVSAFLFNNLKAGSGPESVESVSHLLERLEQLRTGEGREKATHKQDLAAVAYLAQRGWGQKVWDHLTEQVNLARTGLDHVQAAGDADAAVTADREAHTKAELELYAWYHDWATTARTVIKRRDQLIRMGIGERARPQTKKTEEPPPSS